MRSKPRDQSGYVTLYGGFNDAASGSGILYPDGAPFTFTRTATGNYDVRFDTKLVPLVVLANANLFTRLCTAQVQAPGYISCVRVICNTGAGENGDVHFAITAKDRRV